MVSLQHEAIESIMSIIHHNAFDIFPEVDIEEFHKKLNEVTEFVQ
jgi:hypothetical protein